MKKLGDEIWLGFKKKKNLLPGNMLGESEERRGRFIPPLRRQTWLSLYKIFLSIFLIGRIRSSVRTKEG